VPDPPAAHRLIGNAAQEHQGRKLDNLFLLALNQMEQHGNGQGGEAGEQEGGNESHHRTLLSRSRIDK
jgi:hypothetical protein